MKKGLANAMFRQSLNPIIVNGKAEPDKKGQ
jgi:hypothetical protein